MGKYKSIFKYVGAQLIAPLLCGLTACSGVSTNTNLSPSSNNTPSTSTDLNHPSGNTAIVLGSSFVDPVGTLNLIPINPPRTAVSNLQTTHSDAVVTAFQNKLYVVNRLGADNIQVVDPANGFKVTQQFSVGQGTNPQEIVVVSPHKAYVTLYQPENNSSEGITVDDLLIVDPENGTIEKTIDLTPFTTDDGDRFARASSMLISDNRLFVLLQDLPGNLALPPDQNGKLVVIDTQTDSVVDSKELAGRNPIAMNLSNKTGLIYITDADFFDLTSPHGGIEVIDPSSLNSFGMVIDDQDLGGAPGDLEVLNDRGLVTVGFFDTVSSQFVTKVVSFSLDPESAPNLLDVYQSQGFIQDTAVDQNGHLLIGDRDPKVNGVVFVDPTSKAILETVVVGAPPSSITFIER